MKYRGFEFYHDKDGYSPLFVLRDRLGRVLYGAYAPLQSIKKEDGTYLYRSGSAKSPGSFPFPQDPEHHPLFNLQTEFYPDKGNKRFGHIFLKVRRFEQSPWRDLDAQEKLFEGKAAYGEIVKVGVYFLSMDEVRYWTSLKVIHRPGQEIIFASFWIGLGGIILNTIIKMRRRHREGNSA